MSQNTDTSVYKRSDGSVYSIEIAMGKPYDHKEINFRKNGTISSIAYYKVGKTVNRRNTTIQNNYMDSIYSWYGADGKLMYTVQTEHNQWNGEYVEYGDSGLPERILIYQHDKLVGVKVLNFSNGQRKAAFQWKDGVLVDAHSYTKSGEEISSTHVENGNGVVVFCNETGTLCCTCDVIKSKFKHCGPLDTVDQKKRKNQR